jgi:hypothetical protein
MTTPQTPDIDIIDADPHIFHPPQMIFFLREAPTSDADSSAKCAYSIWDIARYNSKLMSKNIELIHINDSKTIAKYSYNRTPEPYKTYIKLVESDDFEDPELQYMYVEESTYRTEKFEHQRNQLVRILGKLNAKSVYFRESSDTTCDITCMTTAPQSSGETDVKKEKMDELMQRNLFDDKEWTEDQIRRQFRDLDRYSKKMRELINKRFSGVTFDSFSSTFTDYSGVSSQLTDVFNMYFGLSCGRQVSKKITYEYTIKYNSYHKTQHSHTGNSSQCPKNTACSCIKGAVRHIVPNAYSTGSEDSDPFKPVSETQFLNAASKNREPRSPRAPSS